MSVDEQPWVEPGVRVRDYTDAAYEALRAANHVLIQHRASEFTPSEFYATIGNLGVLIDSLWQTVGHVVRHLEGQGTEGTFRHGDNRPVADVIAVINAHAAHCIASLNDAGAALAELHTETSGLSAN